MKTSLYLLQSYQDSWADYQRSLNVEAFPVWDYVILTASNTNQATGYYRQLESRKAFLPERTKYVVIPDEGDVRVGSGGATLSVLRWIREQETTFSGKKILVIHSGGDSKRTPQYSALGKIFSPVPHKLPDGRSSTLFDELMISAAAVPSRIREGLVCLSGDVLLLFNPLLIDYSGHGAAVVSFKEHVNTGKDHGVFLRGDDGCVRAFLHKQPVDVLRSVGAVNSADAVDIDTGMIIFGVDVLNSLWSLISSNDTLDDEKYKAFVNDRVRLSLYGDFQYPLAADSTLDEYYKERAEGERTNELMACRTAVWSALRPYRLKLLRLAPAKFIHFGTTREILYLMTASVENYQDLGWGKITNSSSIYPSYNSVINLKAKVGEKAYAEVSYIHTAATIGDGCVLSYIDIEDEVIPSNTVVHGLKQKNGKFVCRIYGVADNPKESKLFGRELPESFGATLWEAPLYPERETIKEALRAALVLHDQVMSDSWNAIERGKSLAEGFDDADPEAILAWNRRMVELVAMNEIAVLIDDEQPATRGRIAAPLTKIQTEWMRNHLGQADLGRKMRLHYYVGMAMGGADGEKEITRAFSSLSAAIRQASEARLDENVDAKIATDELVVKLPLRLNWGGGWSDTPPYCNENGGTVLNAAIELNGSRPVTVRLRRLPEHKVVFESADMDSKGEFSTIEALQSLGDPFDPFALQKAALLVCGVIPFSGGDLKGILTRVGGGIRMDTEVMGVPKGSGLGTSSILGAACVTALFRFLGVQHNDADIYQRVLCMEQLMSTGGGWQDQVGGLTDGIKYITSRPGLNQQIKVHNLTLDDDVWSEMNSRLALIYTGQRRLARNLLRDVVGRYIGNEPEAVYALNEIQRVAALMRFELERGNVDEFAAFLSRHWELSKMIDAGTTNTLIDQIFDAVDDLIAGKMICGAGGGGFLQVVLRKGVAKEQLQARLKEVFSDTEINVWDCKLV